MIGELHDVPIATILSNFSGGSRKRASRLREIYSNANQEELYRQYSNLTTERIDNLDFLIPGEDHLCRVIEIWRLENCERLKCHDTLNGRFYKEEIDRLPDIEAENRKRISEAEKQESDSKDVLLFIPNGSSTILVLSFFLSFRRHFG